MNFIFLFLVLMPLFLKPISYRKEWSEYAIPIRIQLKNSEIEKLGINKQANIQGFLILIQVKKKGAKDER